MKNHQRKAARGARSGNSGEPAYPPIVTQQRRLPAPVRELSPITDPDYVDFTVMTCEGDNRSAEQWARDAYEKAFRSRSGRFILCGLLRFRMTRTPSPHDVGGFRIAERGGTWLRLAGESPLLTLHLVIQADGRQTSMATLMRYHRRVARPLWLALSGKHRQEARNLLRQAHHTAPR